MLHFVGFGDGGVVDFLNYITSPNTGGGGGGVGDNAGDEDPLVGGDSNGTVGVLVDLFFQLWGEGGHFNTQERMLSFAGGNELLGDALSSVDGDGKT